MSVRRAISAGVLVFVVFCGVVVFSASSAFAEPTLIGSFGSATSTLAVDPEPLSEPTRLAVNQSSGDVYVIDAGNDRVERFTGEGEYLSKFDGSATPAGSFALGGVSFYIGRSAAIAVDSSTSVSDPSAGDVYVLDNGHGVIDKFTDEGVYVSQMKFNPEEVDGVAVDSSGDVWVMVNKSVGGYHGEVLKFNDAEDNEEMLRWPIANEGKEGKFFQLNFAGIAVDSNGNVYPDAEPSNVGFSKFTSAGVFEGVVTGGASYAYGVDPTTNDVYSVSLVNHNAYTVVWVLDASAMTSAVSEGSTIEGFGSEQLFEQGITGLGFGIAVNGLAGKVYFTSTQNNDVEVFHFPVVPGVAASTSNAQLSTATLNGKVNPVGHEVSTIQFEYGTSGSYGSTVTLDPAEVAQVGSGTSPVAVSVNIKELLPNTLYHYRLVASNENGTSSTADGVFHTLLAPVTVTDKPAFASEVSQFSAKLNGTINPGNAVTSYHFVYGPTSAYGSSIPVSEGFTPVNLADDAVSEQLTGLQAGTTYHFALQATNGGGTVTGPDETFTTLPVPTPIVSTGGASAVTRGEALLSGAIDPQGWETGYRFEYGTSTSYGSSWPSANVNLGSFQGAQPVSVTVLNLQPGTTYHYRLLATNPGGTSYGPDMTFTTEQYPASVIQEAPVLTASLGFYYPETAKSKTTKKPKGKKTKGKHRKSKRKGHHARRKKH